MVQMKHLLSTKIVLVGMHILFLLGNSSLINANDDSFGHHHRLCAAKIKARELCAKSAILDHVSTKTVIAEYECVNTLKAKDVCAENARINSLCATEVNGMDLLCSTSVVSNNVCVNGNVTHCTAYKAYLAFTALATTYTFGNIIDFDTVVDDPNNDVLLAPTRYVVPVSGYYIVALQIDTENLRGDDVISGIPISVPSLFVNGISRIDADAVYLSFAKSQASRVSGILKLSAGDVLEASEELLVMDPGLGLVPYVGTVDLIGNPAGFYNEATHLIIHYLSSDCPVPCQPCANVTCEPCVVDCPEFAPCDIHCPHCDCCEEHEDYNY